MSVLQRAGLVESTRIGQWAYYRRNEARISELPVLFGSAL
jgi:DNA-binding transcriptional ArsR family regulator